MKKLVLLCSIAIFLFSCSKNFSPNSQESISSQQPVVLVNSSVISKIDGRLQQGMDTKTNIYYIEASSEDSPVTTRYLLKNPRENLVQVVSNRIFTFTGAIDVNITKSLYRSESQIPDNLIPNAIYVQTLTQRGDVTFRGQIRSNKSGLFINYKIAPKKYIPIYLKNLPQDFDIRYVYDIIGRLSYNCETDKFTLRGRNPDNPNEEPTFIKTNYREATLKISTISIPNSTSLNKNCNVWDASQEDFIIKPAENDFTNQVINNEYNLLIARYQGECEPSDKSCNSISQFENKNTLIIQDPNFLLNNSILKNNTPDNKGRISPKLRIIVELDKKNITLNRPVFYDYSYDIPWTKTWDCKCLLGITGLLCKTCRDSGSNHYNFLSGTPVELISIEDIME